MIMKKIQFICYPKCSTCQKAKAYLDAKGIDYQIRDIKTETPSFEELKVWHELSGKDIKSFFNTSGMLYRQLQIKDKLPSMTLDEKLELLASDGMLIKRPLLIDSSNVLIGFRSNKWDEHFK